MFSRSSLPVEVEAHVATILRVLYLEQDTVVLRFWKAIQDALCNFITRRMYFNCSPVLKVSIAQYVHRTVHALLIIGLCGRYFDEMLLFEIC